MLFIVESGDEEFEISAPDLSTAYEIANDMGLVIDDIFEAETE